MPPDRSPLRRGRKQVRAPPRGMLGRSTRRVDGCMPSEDIPIHARRNIVHSQGRTERMQSPPLREEVIIEHSLATRKCQDRSQSRSNEEGSKPNSHGYLRHPRKPGLTNNPCAIQIEEAHFSGKFKQPTIKMVAGESNPPHSWMYTLSPPGPNEAAPRKCMVPSRSHKPGLHQLSSLIK